MARPEHRSDNGRRRRVLAVVDWSVDPEAVTAALRAASEQAPATFGLLVPSRLPGLDWIGDPHASRPCAELQLDAVTGLARSAGVEIERAAVGDPERVSAIGTFLEGWKADDVVLYDRGRIAGDHPLSVRRRVARRTDAEVERVVVSPASSTGRLFQRAPHCAHANAG